MQLDRKRDRPVRALTEAERLYVVDLRLEWTRNPYITLWRPESAGYCYPLSWAGQYTPEEIVAGGDYFTQRRWIVGRGHVGPYIRFGVACSVIAGLATEPDKIGRNRIDGDAGPVVRNSADMRRHLRRLRYTPAGRAALDGTEDGR